MPKLTVTITIDTGDDQMPGQFMTDPSEPEQPADNDQAWEVSQMLDTYDWTLDAFTVAD